MNAGELRDKSVDELETELVALRKEQFNLRMQRGSGQTVRSHIWQQARRNIARVKTIIREKQQGDQA